MRVGKEESPWEATLYIANACFKRDVLAIHLSEVDAGLE